MPVGRGEAEEGPVGRGEAEEPPVGRWEAEEGPSASRRPKSPWIRQTALFFLLSPSFSLLSLSLFRFSYPKFPPFRSPPSSTHFPIESAETIDHTHLHRPTVSFCAMR